MNISRRLKATSLLHLTLSFSLTVALLIGLCSSVQSAPSSGRLLAHGLAPEALRTLDPRLILALSVPRDEASLRSVGRLIPIFGTSPEELFFGVLIQSDLDDAELADLGVLRNARIEDTVTAQVSESVLAQLAAHPGVRAVEAEPWMQTNLDRSTVEARAHTASGVSTTGFTGEGVLYGLIDDGIDVTHDDFRDDAGRTRVLFVWDQFLDGRAPSGFNYGTEYTAAQIDGGQAVAFVNDGGHGSHVAGISVGDGSAAGSPYRGVAPGADIIAVRNGYCDLFCYGGGRPWGEPSTRGSIDALIYLKQKAESLGRPLVVNQSQGVTMGPHDGSTLFEQTYNQLIAQNNIILTVAAGNDQTSDWHGSVTVPPNGEGTMRLVHEGGQNSQDILWFELWWDRGQTYQVTLRSPSNDIVQLPLETNGILQEDTSRGDTVIYYSTQSNPANSQGQSLFSIRNQGGLVQAGTWEVTVESRGGSSGRVHLYCERNQFGLKVQNPDFSSIVAMPGTAANVITVGAYNTRFDWVSIEGQINAPVDGGGLGGASDFSSRGPRRDGVAKPDIAAPGQWIVSVLAAGHENQNALKLADGKHLALAGTSMASPHVAGTIALMLQKDPTLTYNQVKQILRSTARQDTGTGPVPNVAFGAGKLDVKAAVDAVVGAIACTTPGDANGNGSTNVADVVAAVNHILGTPLSKDGFACADLAGADNRITVNDVTAIVNVIVGSGRPAVATPDSEPKAIAWGERVQPSQYELLLDPTEVAGLQAAFSLPKGYELAADPYLLGAGIHAAVMWRKNLDVYHLVAYNNDGALLSEIDELSLVIPVLQVWDGGEGMDRFAVESLELSGPDGRPLVLAPRPDLGEEAVVGGVEVYLTRAFPNPMIGITQVSYDLAESGPVELTVFDTTGRQVRSLVGGYQVAGAHTVHWDGKNDAGEVVADGVYFVRLDMAAGTGHQKILVVR